MDVPDLKPVGWIGPTRRELRRFPEPVRVAMGFALFRAQLGSKHPSAKPLKGFGGAGVLEIVEDHDGDTYRAAYTVRFAEVSLRAARLPEEEQEEDRYPTARVGADPSSAERGRAEARGVPEERK